MPSLKEFKKLSFDKKKEVLKIILDEFNDSPSFLSDIYKLFNKTSNFLTDNFIDSTYELITLAIKNNVEQLTKKDLKKLSKIKTKLKLLYEEEKKAREKELSELDSLLDTI